MPLGTLDRTPPPFFRQGPSALTKVVFFTALALFLMVADSRLALLGIVRSTLATALLPLQRVLAQPVQAWQGMGAYLKGLDAAVAGERDVRQQLALQSEQAARAKVLAQENASLRALIDLRPALVTESLAAEVMYEADDPYSRKVLIDRGAANGVLRGAPVLNEHGVLGQVTRVYPLSSEVTLLTDRDFAIPVFNTRTQQRSAAFGGAGAGTSPTMEVRFMPSNSDVAVGDSLVTSGIDGVFPPGIAVARVATVERRADSGFARIVLSPMASPDGVRHVLVLKPRLAQIGPPPGAASAAAGGWMGALGASQKPSVGVVSAAATPPAAAVAAAAASGPFFTLPAASAAAAAPLTLTPPPALSGRRAAPARAASEASP